MRKKKEVVLEGIEPVIMQEMTPEHFPAALLLMQKLYKKGLGTSDLKETDLLDVALEHYEDLKEVVRDCSGLTPEQFKQIGGSDFLDLLEGWVEANTAFFEKVKSKTLSGAARQKTT